MRPRTKESGFSLLEVLVATTILVVAITALANLCALSTRANTSARTTTIASLLATQKMEQLRALTWGFDELALPLSDTTTDITVVPEKAGAGVGLSPSPAGALAQNTAGYCDFLDAMGQSLRSGTTTPATAAFVRRWSVEPLPSNPANTLVLQVLVLRALRDASRGRQPDDVRIVSVKTRKAW
ncbi:MAG: prepilin-type N-terminal cleavage/methylation domain-containing protein [Acidobacteria bacterium]|nr:prepilin-type N-terminal cleavage/methylation domain-containing protein [Acidobacteriota bacterium]